MYRTHTDADGHRHQIDPGLFLTREELLALEYLPGGELRHTLSHPDRSEETVALNNLLAALNRFGTDQVHGNKFGGYFVVPEEFWRRCKDDLGLRGIAWELLPMTEEGGWLGVLRDTTIYVGGTDDVLLRCDWNRTCWRFKVTARHELIRRPEALALAGPNKGYEDRAYYLPLLPRWGWYGYTPAPLLAAWAKAGDTRALGTLKQMALDVPRRQYTLAAVETLEEMGEPVPPEAYERLERLALREAQRAQHKALT